MGRRASTSLLEVKHGNFSSIKQPRGSAPGSRAASPAASSGSAGPRASGSGASGGASPRRLSDGGPVKDVALSREAYSKARNILLKRSSRASSGSAEGEGSAAELGEEEGGFKRVGQALVSGMSQALFNRRTSAKNHNLIKSLMAAISKEKIFNKLNDLGVDESVTDTLGEMYQAMMDLLIENYEPLENALGELLDEAIGGSLDLEPWVLSLRTAVVGSLMEVLQKQTGERDPEMSKAQELLVTKVVEAAQGMASEVAYMMRMRGPRGSRQLSSAPNGLLEAAGNADGDPQSPRGTSAGSGTPGSHHIGALHGHGLRGHGLHGAGSKDGSSAGHAEASQHFKKTVRNMFMMNAIGGHGPRFHTDVRAEQRKHFDESDAAAARDATAAERSAAVAERRRRKSHVEANGLGEALESLGHQDEDGLSLSSPSSSMSHKRTGASQPSPTSPHGASRSTAAQDAVAPNTPTDPREARGPPREVRAPSAPSSGSRGGSRQSYGLAPSSGSGLSISPETSPHQDGQISANPFGIDSTPSSPRVAGAKSDQDERPDTRPSRGSTGGAEMTVAKILSNQAETVRAPEPKTVAQSRSTRDEAADVAEAVEAGVDHALQADDLGDLAVGAKGDQRRDEGRKGSRRVSGSKPHASKHHASGHDIGSLCIGGLGRRGRTHRSGHAAPTGWLSLKDRRLRTGQALSGPKHRGRSHRAPWGSGEISTDVDAEDEQGFNWETFRMRLLREGIKLKIPAEILHKKSLSHQDALLLERLNPQAAATWHGDMSPSALRKSNAKLTASLSRLLRNSSQKSIASGTSRASLDPNDSDLWSAAPVAPSCNTMLHAAWKSQDAVELEDVYHHRADPWDHEHQHSRIVPPLHLVPLVGSKSRKKGRAVRPVSGAGGKLPILPFRSTCFDPPMSDRLLPEILTFPYVTDDFMESVYSITLEHSRASWSDTNTLATTEPRKAKRGGREARSLRDFHKHFYAV